jgi:hypothetical protein
MMFWDMQQQVEINPITPSAGQQAQDLMLHMMLW